MDKSRKTPGRRMLERYINYVAFFFCLLLTTLSYGLDLKKDAPTHYTVKSGDTLWNISNRYLQKPWEWKRLWDVNPSIKNPNRLHPGDVLTLSYYKQRPYLRVQQNGVIRLSPTAHISDAKIPIPPIPLTDIKPFLDESLILDVDSLTRAPYIVAISGERMLGGQGDLAYVRGLHPSEKLPEGGSIAYTMYRPGKEYIDPVSKQLLGYKATVVGYAELLAGGEPATITLTDIKEGIHTQDRVLINNSPEFSLYFEPQTPTQPIHGAIIEMPVSMPSGYTQGAVGNVVILNVGETSGLKAGDVLGVYAKQKVIKDPNNRLKYIKLPLERLGEVMIFRVFTKTSFALIVRSTRTVYLLDGVTNP